MIESSFNMQTILVGFGIGLLVYYVIKRMRYRLPPGPWCIPLIGHYKVYTSAEVHRKVTELSKEYGPVVRLSFGPVTMVFLNDIDVVIEALVKKKADFAGRPSFSSRDLLEDMIQDNLSKFLKKMTQETEPFSFKHYADLMVFHQLYTICFGEKRSTDDPEVKALIKLNEDLLADFGSGLLEDIVPYLKEIYPTASWTKFVNTAEQLLNVIRAKFKQHMNTFEPGVNRDFIDSMLIARQEAENEGDEALLKKLDDTRLIQTIADIFFAGVDTTRMTMDWLVYYMTRHPELQSQCQEEIDRVVGSDHPSMKHRHNLQFTEACLFETMRLGSVVGFGIPHMTICDSQVGGYDIPNGTTVIINHWALHHDPKYWTDPEKFDPYRYLDENGKMKPTRPDSWLPFSAGRRVCLGETVAKPEILLMCANLLKRFEISLPNGVEPNLDFKLVGFGVELPTEYKIIVKERFA